MEGNERRCRRLAADAAAKRWNLQPDRSRSEVRSEFLRRVAAANFDHDSSLNAEFDLLARRADLGAEARRLAAVEERREIGRLHAAFPDHVQQHLDEVCDFDSRFETPLSGIWFAEVRAFLVDASNARPYFAFDFQRPPALRRPHHAAIEQITEYPAGHVPPKAIPTNARNEQAVENVVEMIRQMNPSAKWILRYFVLLAAALVFGVARIHEAANRRQTDFVQPQGQQVNTEPIKSKPKVSLMDEFWKKQKDREERQKLMRQRKIAPSNQKP
jgi:hypothetical protein